MLVKHQMTDLHTNKSIFGLNINCSKNNFPKNYDFTPDYVIR